MLIHKNSQRRKFSEKGFSLLELLFVVGVSSVVLLGSVRLVNSWAEDLRDLKEAQYLKTVMDATQLYVENNFGTIWSDPLLMNETNSSVNADGTITWTLTNPGRILRLGMDAPSLGRPVNFYLKNPLDGTVPTGFSEQTPLNFETRIFVRNNGVSPVEGARTLEIFVMTESIAGNLLTVSRAANIASKLGPEAGVLSRISSDGSIFTGNFCGVGSEVNSIYGMWGIAMDAMNGVNAPNTDNEYCPATQPALDGRGGYVVMRRVIDDGNDIINDVLYREEIAGRPMANRMQANLEMNGNSILNANAMAADKMVVNGDLDMSASSSTFFVSETARFAGVGSRVFAAPVGTTVASGCQWNDIDSPTRALDAGATPPCNMRGGNLEVAGTSAVAGRNALTVENLNASFSALNAQRMQSNNTTVNGTALYNTSSTITNAEVGGLAAADVTINTSLNTQSWQTGNMDVNGRPRVGGLVSQLVQVQQITVGDLEVNSDADGSKGIIQIGGDLALNNGLTADQATIANMTGCRTNIITRFDLDGDGNRYEIPDDRDTTGTYDCVLGP